MFVLPFCSFIMLGQQCKPTRNIYKTEAKKTSTNTFTTGNISWVKPKWSTTINSRASASFFSAPGSKHREKHSKQYDSYRTICELFRRLLLREIVALNQSSGYEKCHTTGYIWNNCANTKARTENLHNFCSFETMNTVFWRSFVALYRWKLRSAFFTPRNGKFLNDYMIISLFLHAY